MYVYQCAFRVSYLWIKHVCILLCACVFNKEMFHIFLAFVVIIICLSCMLFWSTWSAIFLGIFTIVKWIFLCTTVRVLRYNISLRMKYIHNFTDFQVFIIFKSSCYEICSILENPIKSFTFILRLSFQLKFQATSILALTKNFCIFSS